MLRKQVGDDGHEEKTLDLRQDPVVPVVKDVIAEIIELAKRNSEA